MKRTLRSNDFMYKRITGCDTSAINVLVLQFDDGTELEIEVERFDGGVYGLVTREEQ